MSRLPNLSTKLATVILFISLCVSLSFIAACKSGAQPAGRGVPPGTGGGRGGAGGGEAGPPRVKLVAAIDQTLTQVVTATGTLAADEQASLSFRVAGRLAQLSIDLGSVVRKGQPIAKPKRTRACCSEASAVSIRCLKSSVSSLAMGCPLRTTEPKSMES